MASIVSLSFVTALLAVVLALFTFYFGTSADADELTPSTDGTPPQNDVRSAMVQYARTYAVPMRWIGGTSLFHAVVSSCVMAFFMMRLHTEATEKVRRSRIPGVAELSAPFDPDHPSAGFAHRAARDTLRRLDLAHRAGPHRHECVWVRGFQGA